MNQTFRTASALLRHTWLIDESYALAHEPLINAFLSGNYPAAELEKQPKPVGFALTSAFSGSAQRDRYALDDPALPDNSVLIVEIAGALFKEGFCGSAGSMDYARIINNAYTNDKIIGSVVIWDCPGGQVSGIPTLYDAISNPLKPTVSFINEGCMASAAYWAASPSDFIMASQKTDQIGSIGVFVKLRDAREQEAQMGVKTITVYSTRSTQKNKPFRDALEGDMTALEAELDETADLFRVAVETARGPKLKPVKKGGPDVFEGGLFGAGKAIELGLIDGYGDLNAAVAKVVELSALSPEERKPATQTSGADESDTLEDLEKEDLIEDELEEESPVEPESDITATSTAPVATTEISPTKTPETPMSIFGYSKLVALTAIAGIAAEAVTEEQVTAINAEFEANNFNVVAISQADFTEAVGLKGSLATANTQIATLQAEVARLGKQPGVLPTSTAKTEETIETSADTFISETDAELARLKGK